MSKFDYTYMSNEDTQMICFNKKKWTKENAIKQARYELDIEDENTPMIIFESYVQYGYYSNFDGEVVNGWFINDCYEPVMWSCQN